MLKRPAQNPPERELKMNQPGAAGVPISSYPSIPPLSNFDSRRSNVMLENTGDDDRFKVKYLEKPEKSITDRKEYRVIKLQNGLTVLLISDVHDPCASEDEESDEEDEYYETCDEDEDDNEDDEGSSEDETDSDDEEDIRLTKQVKRTEKMAACAITVGVGSFSDPPEIQGMAHFLEHMVFMGSEKYPEENDFDMFVTKHGGFTNAQTGYEHTTFNFSIQRKHLLSGLDRFAQFFINPLMKKDAIARERESIESEFQMALPSDSDRKEQLLGSFARADHPARKFGWGNLSTLRDNVDDDKLYEELHKFRERHYSAHRMKLAIQAILPLDTLQEYVMKCFVDVPSNGLPPDDFSVFVGANSFDTPAFRRIYKIKPIKDFCKVELTWVLPPINDFYRNKPIDYLLSIMWDEGEGSLISYLRKKLWCIDVTSGNTNTSFEYSSMYSLFCVDFTLTDEGHEHLQEVLDAVFSFINLMKKECPNKRLYDEMKYIEIINFKYMAEKDPEDNTEDLSEDMFFYQPCDYITGDMLFFEYDPDLIKKCMEYLVPDNVNIVVYSKKYDSEKFDKVEPWFQTKYTDVEIPQEWIERWRTIEPLPNFNLPLPNGFMVENFSMITLPANVPAFPEKIYSDDLCEVWYRPDPKFCLPQCFMKFYFISPVAYMSAKNAVLMDLYNRVLDQLLVEKLYPARNAGFEYSLVSADKGIIVKLEGYNEKLPHLFTTIIKYMAAYPKLVTKEWFKVLKEQLIKSYYNAFLKPEKVVEDVKSLITTVIHWTSIDKHTAIQDIDFDEFLEFVKSYTNHLYIRSLVQGNITRNNVIYYVKQCIETLKCNPLLPNTMPRTIVTEVPLGRHYCQLKNFNENDVNSVIINYYQFGIETDKLTAMIDLLTLLMEEPLFNQLRTKEQLGYDIHCSHDYNGGILGFYIKGVTQADKYTTEYVDNRIEKFLKSFTKILEETTETEFNNMKETLIKNKQCADIHLKQEVSRNWNEIVSKDYVFDRTKREVLAIQDIRFEELKEWYAKHMLNGKNFRKLSLHVIGTAPKKDAEVIMNEVVEKSEDNKSEVFNDTKDHRNIKYLFEFIIDDQKKREMGNNYIINIEEFKKGLKSYSKTDSKVDNL